MVKMGFGAPVFSYSSAICIFLAEDKFTFLEKELVLGPNTTNSTAAK